MVKQIPLSQGKIAIVDDEDYEWLNQWKWTYQHKHTNCEYAIRTSYQKPKKHIQMHRLMLNAKKGQICDHKNHNGLDNRRENIWIVSRRQNLQNRKFRRSIYPGIYWYPITRKWHSRIRINGKRYSLGYYRTEWAAFFAYSEACRKNGLTIPIVYL